MKLLESGWLAKDGIHHECKFCHCKILIEDRNDWVKKYYNDAPHIRVPEYEIVCPECKYKNNFGYNPNESNYLNGRILFNRPDWKERYSVVDDATEHCTH